MKKDMQNHCINRHLKSNCLQNLDNSLKVLCQDWTNKIKILAQLISIQKSSHTSFPAVQNINVKQERFGMNYDNDQCEIVEHQIDKLKLFYNPYLYKRFETDQLPNLEKESLKFYKDHSSLQKMIDLLHITSLKIETYLKMLSRN